MRQGAAAYDFPFSCMLGQLRVTLPAAGWGLSLLTMAVWPVPFCCAAYVKAAVPSVLNRATADPTSLDALSR